MDERAQGDGGAREPLITQQGTRFTAGPVRIPVPGRPPKPDERPKVVHTLFLSRVKLMYRYARTAAD
ncbi:hypothetical protein [Streptomyces beigongshangae]|uniref:hypothetical protein n=1 Tax=Streptomyces beigongshangae TaxID=2841597 RepID=UPI001C84EEAA|nr:hypothetical protein [Streptomyces sp. REN17]